MGYSSKWKPTPDWKAIVEPYIPNLTRVNQLEPLIIHYDKRYTNRIKWQWYDFLHHHFPSRYKLKFRNGPGRNEITLTISLAQEQILSRLPRREPEEEEDNRSDPFDTLDQFYTPPS